MEYIFLFLNIIVLQGKSKHGKSAPGLFIFSFFKAVNLKKDDNKMNFPFLDTF